MTKDVLLSISGLQYIQSEPLKQEKDQEQNQPIEIITPATYYYKNGKHYVLYDEIAEGEQETTKNTLQFCEDYLSVTKRGNANVHMVIEKEKKNVTYYYTPVGNIHISLDGETVTVEEKENMIQLHANYGLDINYERVADCHINIQVQSKEAGEFTLV